MNRILAACVMGLVMAGTTAASDPFENDLGGGQPQKKDARPKARPAAKVVGLPGAADIHKIKEMLEALDIAAEIKGEAGNEYLTYTHAGPAGMNFYPSISLSRNRNVVWLNVAVRGGKGELPPHIARKLLEQNTRISPFLFRVQGDQLMLSGFELNTGMTLKVMKRFVDEMAAHIRNTETLWNDKKPEGGNEID